MSVIKNIKLGPYLKEIRLHFCQTSPESKGARDFVKRHYVSLKQNNPSFPILIRECSNIEPKIYARYDKGKETCILVKSFDSEQVLDTVSKLAKQ